MRSRCVRIPIKATAHAPIDRPDTYQRLPTARPHLRTAAGPYIGSTAVDFTVECEWLGRVDSCPSSGLTRQLEPRLFRTACSKHLLRRNPKCSVGPLAFAVTKAG